MNMSGKLYKEEVTLTKELGERIGYGNLMQIASALWAIEFQRREWPIDGIFVPTTMATITDGGFKAVKTKERDNYIRKCMEVLNGHDNTG